MALIFAQDTVGYRLAAASGRFIAASPNDLEIVHYGIHSLLIGGKSCEVEALDVGGDALDRLFDIVEPQPPSPRRHEWPLLESAGAAWDACRHPRSSPPTTL